MSQALVKAKKNALPPPAKYTDGARLRENFAKFKANIKSKNTVRVYASQWRAFSDWCADNGHVPLPAEPATLAAYIEQMFDDGKNLRTLTVAKAAISDKHAEASLGDPFDHPAVQATLKGARHTMIDEGLADKRVNRTITLEELRKLANACDDSLTGLRNRALILVAFGGWFRKSDLLNMRTDKLEWRDDAVVVELRKSKTNKTGKPEYIPLPRVSNEWADLCPYSALQEWLRSAGIEGEPGPVFRRTFHGVVVKEGLNSPDYVYKLVARLAKKAKLTGISPHRAFRATPITLAILRGSSMPEVMKRARHKSAQTTTMYFDELAANQAAVSKSVYD